MYRFIWLLLLVICFQNLFGQSHPLGLNPSSTDWKQIDTEHVQVIFPIQAEDQAQRVVNLVHFLNETDYYPLGVQGGKVSIVLHNRTMTANGFVTVGPFRSELYLNGPMQNFSGAIDWLDLLTIHEYRHVQQYNNAKKGWTKIVTFLFGQNGWGSSFNLSLPRWFREGDAVWFETAMTNGGRGRMPQFENEYKALLLSGRKLNYEKASATSFKEFVPDHYTLGYHLTTSLMKKNGVNVWGGILDDAVRYKSIVFPLSASVKKQTGSRSPGFFKETMNDLKTEWTDEIEKKSLTSSERLNKNKKTFTNYFNPKFIDNSNLIFEKRGFQDIPTYYSMNLENGQEKKIMEPGFFDSGNRTISISGNWILWSELAYHPRWSNAEYSVIMGYNLKTGIRKQITSGDRYLAPAFDPRGEKIAAIHVDGSNNHQLHILSFATSELVFKFDNDENFKFRFPTWIDDKTICVVVQKNSRNAIAKVDIENGNLSTLTPFWDEQISYLTFKDGYVYFNGIFTGTDEIFALELGSGKIFQVSSTKFGATQPSISPDGSKIIYSEFTIDGYDLKLSSIDKTEWVLFSEGSPTTLDFYKSILTDFNPVKDVEDKTFEKEEFKELNGFQLHSWFPWALPPSYGMQLFGNNTIRSISAIADYRYNQNEKTSSYGATIQYGKFFPVFEFGYEFSNRDRYVPIYEEQTDNNGNVTSATQLPLVQAWNENKAEVSMVIPLNLTKGNLFSWLWLTSTYSNRWVEYESDQTGSDEAFGAMEFEVNYNIRKRRVIQLVKSRLGFSLLSKYKRTINTSLNDSYYFQTTSRVFLPGLWKTHSFNVTADYKKEPYTAEYKFTDEFFYARGYGAIIHDEIYKLGINYEIPLIYPDLPLGPIVFVQRIRSNFFFDYSQFRINTHDISEFRSDRRPELSGRFPGVNGELRSAGVEVLFDFRFIRTLDMSLGFRYSYLLEDEFEDRTKFDFVVVSLGVE